MKTRICDVVETGIKGLWGNECEPLEHGVPVIKTNNLSYEGVIDFSEITYRDIELDKAQKNWLCNGDILVEKSGGTKTHTVGYVSYFDGESNKYVCNNFILALRPLSNKVFGKFLFYQMRYMYESGLFSDCYNRTTGIQNLQQNRYLSKEIKLPILSEQQTISHVLDSIVQMIGQKRQQLAQLDELIKSRFVEMFGDVSVNDKNWITQGLSSLGTLKNGMNFHYDDKGVSVRVLGVGDFKDNSVIDNAENLSLVTLAETPAADYYLQNHDLIFVRSNGNKALVGRCVEAIPNDVPTVFSGFCIRFRNESKSVNIKYLLYFFKQDEIRAKIAGRGANIQNLNQKILSAIDVPLPPLELQNRFADFVQKTEQAKTIVKQQIADLQELLDSKMEEYFG